MSDTNFSPVVVTYSFLKMADRDLSPTPVSPPLRHTTDKAVIAPVPIMPLVPGGGNGDASVESPGNIEYITSRLSSKPLTTASAHNMAGNSTSTATSIRRSIVEHLPISTTFPKTIVGSSDTFASTANGYRCFNYWDVVVDMAHLFEKTILAEHQQNSAESSPPDGVVMLCVEEAKQVIDGGGRAGEAVVCTRMHISTCHYNTSTTSLVILPCVIHTSRISE